MINKKNLIKSIIIFIAVLTVAVICSSVVCGDIIYVPDDNFYSSHQCRNMNRTFTASGSEGSIFVWENPESDKTYGPYENGMRFFVYQTYTDKSNEQWGLVCIDEVCYWIKMKDVTVVYDGISFREEHSSELHAYNKEYTVTEDMIEFWTYPNSGIYIVRKTNSIFNNTLYISITYTDSNNNMWGYISYYYGIRDIWIRMTLPGEDAVSSSNGSSVPVAVSNISDSESLTKAAESYASSGSDCIGLPSVAVGQINSDDASMASGGVLSSEQTGVYQSENSVDFINTYANPETADLSPFNNKTKVIVLSVLIFSVLVLTVIMVNVFWKKDKKNG